jgi:hypothetical protein
MLNRLNEWALTSNCHPPVLDHSDHPATCQHGGTAQGLIQKFTDAANGTGAAAPPRVTSKTDAAVQKALKGFNTHP